MATKKISELTALTVPDGAEELVVNDGGTSKKIAIEDLFAGDNVKAKFGAGDDLQIYHDGSNSYIKDGGTGSLKIQGVNLNLQSTSGESYIDCVNDGAVYVYHNNAAKLATTDTGVDVTGTVTADDVLVGNSYAIPTGGIDAETQAIVSNNAVASGNAALSILSRSSGESRINLGSQLDEDGWQLSGKAGVCFRLLKAGTEFWRIDSSGNLLVGTTDTSLYNTTTSTGVLLNGSTGNISASRSGGRPMDLNRLASDGDILRFAKDGTTVGTISVTGSATAYNTSSDYRLKEADVPMTGATERVKALRPINFAWKVDGSRVDGFFAHELAEVVPEAAHGTKDAMRTEEYEVTPAVVDAEGVETTAAVMGTRSVPDYQGIDQSKLVPLLTAALQEAIARIEALENA